MHTPSNPKIHAKSPFLVIKEFISPLTCEEVIGEVDFNGLAVDPNTHQPLKTTKNNPIADKFLEGVFERYVPMVESYYGVQFDSIESISYEWFSAGYVPTGAVPDGFTRTGDQWMKSTVDDFIGVFHRVDSSDITLR